MAKSTEKKGLEKKGLEIPRLEQAIGVFRLIGDSPLLLNNKLSVAWAIAARYQGGKTKHVDFEEPTPDEAYAGAFYTLPSSPHPAPHAKGLYGVPASGIKKCLQKGIRPAGFTDNTTIGQIQKAFRVLEDEGGMCLIRHNGFSRDARPVNVGSGAKTVPNIRHRPIFPEWEIHVKIIFNQRILNVEQLCNLILYAGQYIGICELRAEKAQGECGGFSVESELTHLPKWASDKAWGVSNIKARLCQKISTSGGFRVLKSSTRKRAA